MSYAARWVVVVRVMSNLSYCGHAHRTIEAADRCARRLRRHYPNAVIVKSLP